eukprot:Seg187.12 transcript_id=Seg187.12/GoldUCD/mRNA.D3Y31 product="Conodipine-M alpha chain" protein_id=Seg187.12/GoldUCD/D3Y31
MARMQIVHCLLITLISSGSIDLAWPRPEICKADKYANGCSVPLGMNAPYKDQFTPACNKHDICYGCGHHYNWSRTQCDKSFHEDMNTICKQLHHWRNKRFIDLILDAWNFFHRIESGETRCQLTSDMYYEGVRLFADSHFDRIDHDYCKSNCAVKHGSPDSELGDM